MTGLQTKDAVTAPKAILKVFIYLFNCETRQKFMKN